MLISKPSENGESPCQVSCLFPGGCTNVAPSHAARDATGRARIACMRKWIYRDPRSGRPGAGWAFPCERQPRPRTNRWPTLATVFELLLLVLEKRTLQPSALLIESIRHTEENVQFLRSLVGHCIFHTCTETVTDARMLRSREKNDEEDLAGERKVLSCWYGEKEHKKRAKLPAITGVSNGKNITKKGDGFESVAHVTTCSLQRSLSSLPVC